jgi:hypothetical protein
MICTQMLILVEHLRVLGMKEVLRSNLSLNNPQNNEMKICEKYEVDMLKIIIIIISYNVNNFITHITIL